MNQEDMKKMVLGLLTRDQMIHGFVENDLLTDEVLAMDTDTLANEVAKNLIKMNPLLS